MKRRQFIRPKSLFSVMGATLPLPEQSSVSGALPPPATQLLRLGRHAMACDFELMLPVSQRERLDRAIECLDLIHALERQMTVFRDDSELSTINRQAGLAPVPVEARLFELLELAVKLSRETGGAFDATAGPLARVWGFHRRQGQEPSSEKISETLQAIGSDALELDPVGSTVYFRKPGLELNLGAIGKGHALDRTGEQLTKSLFSDFLLHSGFSTILAAGASPAEERGKGWPVNIRHPRRQDSFARLYLHDQALATSGIREQHFVSEGKTYGHIIDPRKGRPTQGCLSATAVAPTAAEADALSTAFFIMTLEEVEDFCGRHSSIGAVIVPEENSGGKRLTVHTFGIDRDDLEIFI